MKKNRTEIEAYINALKGYEGYVQFSNTKVRMDDIFKGFQDIILVPSDSGFVYEAHFFNGSDCIAIRQLNDSWYVDETKDVSLLEENVTVYKSKLGNVQMVQVWEAQKDDNCEGMEVQKLKKVLFAGFVDGGLK